MLKSSKLNTRIYYGWIILASSSMLGLIVGGIRFSLPLFIPYWTNHFGCSIAAASFAISITSLVQCGVGIFSGRLIDIKGPKIVAILGCLLIGLSLLFVGKVSTLGQFYLVFIILGIGLSALYLIPNTIVNKWFIQKRGLVTGLSMAGGGIGTFIFPIFIGIFLANGNWKSAQIFMGIVALCFIGFAFFLKHYPEDIGLKPYGASETSAKAEASKEVQTIDKGIPLSGALKTSVFWLILLIGFFAGFGHYIPWTQLPNYIGERGLSGMTGAYTISIIGGCSAVGRILGGGVGDKIGKKRSLGISFIFQALSIVYLMHAKTVSAFYIYAIVSGFAHGGMVVQFGPVIADFYGRFSLASIMGIFQAVTGAGWALGSWFGGYIFDITGSFQPAFIISVSVYLCAFIVLFFLKKPKVN